MLKEYEKSGKSSVFVDKRIGEENDELDEFDKAIRRTQRERQVSFECQFVFDYSSLWDVNVDLDYYTAFFDR